MNWKRPRHEASCQLLARDTWQRFILLRGTNLVTTVGHMRVVPKVSVLIFYLNVYWTHLILQVISFKVWPLGSYTVVPKFVEFHTKFDSVPLFDIFLYRKRNEAMKHDHTQTAAAQDWLNQSSWNKYGHAAKITTNAPIYINEVLPYQFVHRKISTRTFGTTLVRLTL